MDLTPPQPQPQSNRFVLCQVSELGRVDALQLIEVLVARLKLLDAQIRDLQVRLTHPYLQPQQPLRPSRPLPPTTLPPSVPHGVHLPPRSLPPPPTTLPAPFSPCFHPCFNCLPA